MTRKAIAGAVGLLIAAIGSAALRVDQPKPDAARLPTPSTIILVRHAEKSSGPTDAMGPDLCPEGRARAEALTVALADCSLDAILVTDRRRTQQTAEPIAKQRALTPRVMAANAPPEDVAAAALESGECVLIVGHSNTIPAIIESLGGPAGIAIAENDYENLFVVTTQPGRNPSLIRARYGPRVTDPPCSP